MTLGNEHLFWQAFSADSVSVSAQVGRTCGRHVPMQRSVALCRIHRGPSDRAALGTALQARGWALPPTPCHPVAMDECCAPDLAQPQVLNATRRLRQLLASEDLLR